MTKTEKDFHFRVTRRRYAMPRLLNWLGLLGEGVEVGVDEAKFSCVLLKSWKGRVLHLVDPWRSQPKEVWPYPLNRSQPEMERSYRKAVRALSCYGERAHIIREFSVEAAELFDDSSLDFVYIDGNHKLEAVQADIEAWCPKVKEGGLVSGHDYCFEGVQPVVDDAVRRYGYTLGRCAAGKTWYFIRRPTQ